MQIIAASVDPRVWFEQFVKPPLSALGEAAAKHTPSLVGGLVVLLLLYVVARIMRAVISRLLGKTKLDEAVSKTRIQGVLTSISSELTASKALASFVYIAFLLLGVSTATETWGLPAVQEAITKVLGYFPKLVSAVLVFAVGGYLAGLARKTVGAVLREARSAAAGALERLTEGALLVVVALVAIDILGVDLSFLTANLTLAVGAVLLALTFLFGWSMRRPAEELIANYYLRRLVSVGDHISFGDVEGTVTRFAPLGLLLRDPKGQEVFLPARHILVGMRRLRSADAASTES